MDVDLKSEAILSQVRDELNKLNIKLWLDPYYSVDNGVGCDENQALQLLSEQITEKLNIGQECWITALKELQGRALARLKSNAVFKETGIASLKIKISGRNPTNLSVDIPLTSDTNRLIEEISKVAAIESEKLKLIANGRVLQSGETLVSQGIKNGSQLMAVVIEKDGDLQEDEKRMNMLKRTKKDLKLLAGRTNSNHDNYFQIENQFGEALSIPPHERKALVTAMTLHEKGRAALKKKDYALALIMFLEADNMYSDCTSQLLNACDNYALLHLDIAWCYLCLRNPAQIPDADRRLTACEEKFHKSYGPNLERLLAIKGSIGNEMCLFMRLHLLQGVVHFHQNRRADAKRLFEQALTEVKGLKVDDNSMTLLMELGYSSSEALIGLRATYGNVEAAEELINRKRKERKDAREQNRTKLKLERERTQLGLCQDGKQYCDPKMVEQLQGMGFNRHQSVAALKLSNNVISEAISVIQDSPHLLPNHIPEELIAQVASLGYDVSTIKDLLNTSSPHLLGEMMKKLSSFSDSSGPSTSTAVNGIFRSDLAKGFIDQILNKRKKEIEAEKEALQRLSEDLNTDLTEDHLDLNLDQEEQFLTEYMSLLSE